MTATSINLMTWYMALLWMMLIGLAGVPLTLAQEMIWVTAEGTAPLTDGDQDNARQQAIAAAEHSAVGNALASGISVETLLVNLRLVGSISGAIPFGKVRSKKILQEGPVPAANDDHDKHDRRYRVRIKAGVIREPYDEVPSFFLNADINQSVFNDGDELEINIQSSKDCYLAIFNILEDEKIIRLLPNYMSTKNFLSTNEKFVFPCAKDRAKGLKLRVHLPQDKASTTESIYILAVTQPFEMKSMDVQEGIFGVYSGQTAFMKDLIREVVGIPLSRRAEVLLQYEIRKTRQGT